MQSGDLLSPVPWGRHMLGWMFKAEEFGTKQVLRQLKAANLLSYAAVEDVITTGMASTLPCPAQSAALSQHKQQNRLHLDTLTSTLAVGSPEEVSSPCCMNMSGGSVVQTDMLAKFRTEELGLPSNFIHNNYVRARKLHSIPFMYCFSPVLVPFPSDWDRNLIDIVGFFFLDSTQSDYKPDPALEVFLAEKDKPVYIGFGSLVVGNVEVCLLSLTSSLRKCVHALLQAAVICVLILTWETKRGMSFSTSKLPVHP